MSYVVISTTDHWGPANLNPKHYHKTWAIQSYFFAEKIELLDNTNILCWYVYVYTVNKVFEYLVIKRENSFWYKTVLYVIQ